MIGHGAPDPVLVTGYGLVGHLNEMAAAPGLGAWIRLEDVPMLPGVSELIAAGYAPDGTRRTLENSLAKGWFVSGPSDDTQHLLLADAQTPGGLLLAVSPADADKVVDRIGGSGDTFAAVVGELIDGDRPGLVSVEPRAR